MAVERAYFVYILASKPHGTLYVGVTNDIVRRMAEHKGDIVEGFTKTYGVHTLVFFEPFDNPADAIICEKRIKRWRRPWKIRLIEERNPSWRDLCEDIAGSSAA